MLASVAMTAPAAAQFPTGKLAKDTADIRVNYSIQVPLKDDSDDTQTTAMEHGRKMLYEMSGRECGLILSTIAKSCQLAGLSIQSNVRRVRGKGRRAPSLRQRDLPHRAEGNSRRVIAITFVPSGAGLCGPLGRDVSRRVRERQIGT